MQNVNVPVVTPVNPYTGKINQITQRDKELYKSSLGTPVMSNLTFKGKTYTDNTGRKVSFPDLVLDLVLMTVSQTKKIIETEIQGQDGVVDEYIGLGPYEITIDGIINGPNGHYPIDEHNALHQVAKAGIDIDVVSTYLHNIDIYSLVVRSFVYDQEAGGYSKQAFTIQAKSSTPVFLQFL